MPVVRDTAKAGEGKRRAITSVRLRWGVGLALGAFLALAWGVCTRGVDAPTAASPAVNRTIRLATCEDWNRGTGPQRFGTLRVLAQLSAGQVPGRPELRGPALEDQQAYDTLGRSCAPPLARGFKLYKLYDRSAAFVGH